MSNSQDGGLSAMDPRRMTRRVRNWVSYDATNGSDSQREIFDSHVWGDESAPSWRSRIFPSTPAGWFLAAGLSIIGLGFILWTYKFSAAAYHNPDTLLYTILLGAIPMSYLYGRHKVLQLFKEFAWSELYYGDSAEIRPGKTLGTTDDGHTKFVPMKGLSFAGYRPKYLQLRDIFPPTEVPNLRSKMHRAKSDGSGEAVDRLHKGTTASHETETIGEVLVTHTSGLQPDRGGRETDRYTKPPNLFDEKVGRELTQELENKANIQIPALQEKYNLAMERMRDKGALEGKLLKSIMDPAGDMIEFLAQMQDNNNRKTNGTESNKVEEDYGELQSRIEEKS